MTENMEPAPLDIEALPDFWDARRARLGKPDKSTCAAELRLALEKGCYIFCRQPEEDNG
jgi:hypothetical protein